MARAALERIVDSEVERGSRTAGALVIKGARACGETSTAKQFAASSIQLDRDDPETAVAKMNPVLGLEGERPRLIDEWQAVPAIWNEVRHSVDERSRKGQFILTGSATPDDVADRHSGAGRMRSVVMRTMSLRAQGVEAERVSLADIIAGEQEHTAGTKLPVADCAELIVAGGFPGFFSLDAEAREAMEPYHSELIGVYGLHLRGSSTMVNARQRGAPFPLFLRGRDT